MGCVCVCLAGLSQRPTISANQFETPFSTVGCLFIITSSIPCAEVLWGVLSCLFSGWSPMPDFFLSCISPIVFRRPYHINLFFSIPSIPSFLFNYIIWCVQNYLFYAVWDVMKVAKCPFLKLVARGYVYFEMSQASELYSIPFTVEINMYMSENEF